MGHKSLDMMIYPENHLCNFPCFGKSLFLRRPVWPPFGPVHGPLGLNAVFFAAAKIPSLEASHLSRDITGVGVEDVYFSVFI